MLPHPDSLERPYGTSSASDLVDPLSGQTAVITGSTQGIGLATAQVLHLAGAAVVVNGRSVAAVERAVDAVAGGGGAAGVRGVVGDAADPDTVAALAAAADELGPWRICVANVGGGTAQRQLADLTEHALADSYRRNVLAMTGLVRAAAAVMRAAGYGRIVTVASLAGRRYGRVSGPDYSMHKAAVIGLTRHAAAELGPTGVTVNCVAPGIIDTPRARQLVAELPPGSEQTMLAATPVGRWGTPHEVAAAIRFLVDPAAGYVTGHTLDVNGGAFMG